MKEIRFDSEKLLGMFPIVCALAIIAAGVVYFLPQPSPAKSLDERRQAQLTIKEEAEKSRTRHEANEKKKLDLTWALAADDVEPKAMEIATALARKHMVTLTAFRPQKPAENGQLTQLSFVLAVEGSFPAVAALAKELGTPSHKLTVNLIQITSADAASDKVTATIGLVAYRDEPVSSGNEKI